MAMCYKVQVGIYSKDEVVEMAKVSEIEGIEKTEIADGIFKFTSGYFSNIQAAMIRLNKLTKMGYEGCYLSPSTKQRFRQKSTRAVRLPNTKLFTVK